MRARPARRLRCLALTAAAVALLTAGTGCGLVGGTAHSAQPTRTGHTSGAPTGAGSTAGATAPASPAGDGSQVLARVDVSGPGGKPPGRITVTLGPEGSDVTALNSLGSAGVAACGLTDGATRWLPVEIDYADHGAGPSKQENEHSNLAARVEVRGTPGHAGDVGVLLASPNQETAGCTTPGVLPAADTFSTVVIFGGYHVTTTGYVVARVPAGADGAASPLHGVTLAITGLKKEPDDIWPPGSWPWQVDRFETGHACPESPASICVPLG